jgi:hypothetical protein
MRPHWWQFWKPGVPTPGSQAAAKEGCLCPVGLNNNGATKPKGGWVVRTACPMHGQMEKDARPLPEG